MPNNWSSAPSDAEKQKATRHYVPSKDKLRQMAMASREGGRFRCPICKCSFSMTYVKYIRKNWEEEMVCKDCYEVTSNASSPVKL